MKERIRILQLIDSLRPGGAERMAVTYANALVGKVDQSFLGCTRLEGKFKKKLSSEVGYIYLNKKNTFDFVAFSRLRRFIKFNKINIIQAHGSSVFFAVMLKTISPNLRIIWHDHLGERALKDKSPGILRPASRYIDGIISANPALAKWSEKNLRTSHISSIRNFLPKSVSEHSSLILEGGKTKKIICVANLRKEKDHLNLLMAFKILSEKDADTTLHLVGKIYTDDYFHNLEKFIKKSSLEEKVFFYGQQENIEGLLGQADIGVLASYTEGLPVALLEYGRSGLPVVCTRVGECTAVVEGSGIVVPPNDPGSLAKGLLYYLDNEIYREKDGKIFQQKILTDFSEAAVIPDVLHFYEQLM